MVTETAAVRLQEEKIRDLNGDHGREHGPDQIEEIRDIVHGVDDGRGRSNNGHRHRGPLFADGFGNGHAGHACGVGVQKGGGHGGQDDDQQSRHAQPGLYHNLGNIRYAGKNRRAHADHVHPDAHQAVDHRAGRRGRQGFLSLPGIVADQGQPGQGHGNGQLHGSPKTHGLPFSGHTSPAAAKEDHLAQDQG